MVKENSNDAKTNDNTNNNTNTKKTLIIISILVIIFFGLMIISTNDNYINVNYNINDNVILDNSISNQIVVGSISIENSGLIPKRVKLKKYVICQLSDKFGSQTYNVNYIGKTTNSYDVFGNRNINYIDISYKQKIDLDMKLFDLYNLKSSIKKYNLYNSTMPFYLFEIDNQDNFGYYNYYNYCDNAKKDDAEKIINVKFNYSIKDLENFKGDILR